MNESLINIRAQALTMALEIARTQGGSTYVSTVITDAREIMKFLLPPEDQAKVTPSKFTPNEEIPF